MPSTTIVINPTANLGVEIPSTYVPETVHVHLSDTLSYQASDVSYDDQFGFRVCFFTIDLSNQTVNGYYTSASYEITFKRPTAKTPSPAPQITNIEPVLVQGTGGPIIPKRAKNKKKSPVKKAVKNSKVARRAVVKGKTKSEQSSAKKNRKKKSS